MNSRIVVIIATADPAKAEAGMMYAVNSLKYGWIGVPPPGQDRRGMQVPGRA